MPHRPIAISSLIAVAVTAAVIACAALYDLATDTSGTASDAAAKGAPAIPVVLFLLWGTFFAIGRAYPSTSPVNYRRSLLITLLVATVLAAIPATIAIGYGRYPLSESGTYLPWLFGLLALSVALVPGALAQAWFLRSYDVGASLRHNKSLERSRDR